MLIVLAISFILTGASAASNNCPNVEPVKNFDFKRYAKGRWFEIARYDFFSPEKGLDCGLCDYNEDNFNGNPLIHQVVCKDVIKETKTIKTLNWTVTPAPDANGGGKLLYSFYKMAGNNVTLTVLDTDYDHYTILYFCSLDEVTKAPIELAWVKSRTPSLEPSIRATVDSFLAAHPSVDESRMFWDHFTHEDCLIDL